MSIPVLEFVSSQCVAGRPCHWDARLGHVCAADDQFEEVARALMFCVVLYMYCVVSNSSSGYTYLNVL